ncbi:multidrug MFS transporter [Gordonia sp. CNJ-863]|jgi:EmrB/QacA subfamily drug resistance transporter|uniref:Multidrug MFS transporter n=1 Tax=Gordonia alkanivorans CGMCC 6845 TaxID=1423140 RepID=W9DH72_9ACTN|nr:MULTISPECIES: DHA2 family efflux MFS transporter permease subunit [Gordonia]ETA08898.1 multidrug MFS transporter [Gordonia alkanivorans CGMCC 6845]MDH3018940.1 DHA2 family efflux MFS transporter permease subunit [Gordonia alkanivorans]MDJ0005997.1 DHA2 family efflux MFS transporter permease subunit [Gordonia alkanivorans]MDJ0027110.1 DHA2 family efflux MFS transporter permease subunit [Gordonia alkanivorans]MDJ0096307.1 DHA2 family efflux MFS transporter permease subunit [Gordonia alkanivor
MTRSTPDTGVTGSEVTTRPWAALMALCVGFFMILVDMTIVAVAQPRIQADLNTDVNGVVWVTSAYLLTYAVPLLITGRLGDKYGPKSMYQIGLIVFTIASVWCGLSDSIGELIAARALQGVGAALITPQTMSLITRTFPPEKRGAAMGIWGTVAGVATLVGPLLGGVLTDAFGWEWIFFINVPVGIAGLVLAAVLVPQVETNDHQFDWIGVGLSAVGLSALVFGIQEGESFDWAAWVWALIGGGLIFLGVFVWWQSRIRTEPLLPLSLFRDRNFALATVGISSMGFAVSAMMIPLTFFLQLVGGMTPTQSAVVLVPMAILTGILAPIVGRVVDRVHPRAIVSTALLLNAIAIGWLGVVARPDTPVWMIILPLCLMGVASAGIWAPLAATATRNLPWHQAGAGAGVYNTLRVIGSVLGSAMIGALLQSRLAAELPGIDAGAAQDASGANQLPEFLREGFASAMGQSLFLPAAALLVGVVATFFFVRPAHQMPPAAAVPGGPADAAAGSATHNAPLTGA